MERKIRALIKEAMIERNKNKQITYKNILEAAQKIAKTTNSDVTDEMLVKATKNEIKQLNDVIGYYADGSAQKAEIIEKINYCEAVLPKMASDEDIMSYLTDNNIEKNIGVCMKALKSKFGANMDGKSASIIAKQYANS